MNRFEQFTDRELDFLRFYLYMHYHASRIWIDDIAERLWSEVKAELDRRAEGKEEE